MIFSHESPEYRDNVKNKNHGAFFYSWDLRYDLYDQLSTSTIQGRRTTTTAHGTTAKRYASTSSRQSRQTVTG